MTKEKKNKEKTCLFFSSDYHFEMITLPYINKEIESKKNVVILTENDLQNTVKTVVSRLNLEKEKKERILNIDWNNNDLEKFKIIKRLQKEGKEVVVYIKGKQNYIENVNGNIRNWVKEGDIKIVDCYDIDEVIEDVEKIAGDYSRVLKTIRF